MTAVQEPPEPPRTELIDKALAGGLSSFPFVGGVVGAFYQHYIEAPFSKRKLNWERELVDVVNELASRVDALSDDDVLLDAMINATNVAQTTSRQEKIQALRNGILNSVAPGAPTADEQARFFRLVAELTPSHIVVLRFLEHPATALANSGGSWPEPGTHSGHVSLAAVLEVVAPHLNADEAWRELLVDDLVGARLCIDFGTLEGTWMEPPDTPPYATPLGSRFLRFISENA